MHNFFLLLVECFVHLTPFPVSPENSGEKRGKPFGDGEQGAKIRAFTLKISMLYLYHIWYTYNKNRDIRAFMPKISMLYLYHIWYTYNKNHDILRQSEHTNYTYRNKHKNNRGKYHTQHDI